MTAPAAVQRVEVTEIATGHQFVRACTMAAAATVYTEAKGYRLRPVWGFAMPDGFHYLRTDGAVAQ